MLCKWCGMESVTTDQCSWCHRVLTAAPAETLETAENNTDGPGITQHSAEAAEPDRALPAEEAGSVPIGEREPASAADTQTGSEGAGDAAAPEEEEVSTKAPWTIAPPVPPPAPSSAGSQEAARPIIGVRRPARPAPGMPAPVVARRAGAGAAGGVVGSGPHAPAPAVPAARRPIPPAAGASARSQSPVAADTRGRSPAPDAGDTASGGALTDRPVPRSRPAVPAGLTAPRPASVGVKPAAPLLDAETLPPPENDAASAPSLGTFTPAKSKYYVGQVVDPVSGTHYDADTGQPVSGPMRSGGTHLGDGAAPVIIPDDEMEQIATTRSPWIGVGAYTVALGAVLFLTGLFAFVFTSHYVLPLLVGQFVGAMLLPVFRVAPWADEDADDAVLFVLLTLVCGPIVGLIIYGVISAMRQDTNPAVLGCFIVSALARIVVEIAVGVTGEGASFALGQLAPFSAHFDLRLMFVNWTGLAALAGWYTASIFHKLDE